MTPLPSAPALSDVLGFVGLTDVTIGAADRLAVDPVTTLKAAVDAVQLAA